MNKDDLLDQIKSYKKLDYNALKEESPKQMEYLSVLNIPEVMRFKLKVGMTPLIMMNFQSDKCFAHQLWRCSGCFQAGSGDLVRCRDTQKHVVLAMNI